MVITHRALPHTPWFADPADGTTLHRYLDEQFVPRFLQDVQAGRLTRTADQAWRREDRFGGRADLPTLRLPVHRCYYVASCEVSCEAPGLPAFDPKRIVSAGFVVRRGRLPAAAQRWLLRDGAPLGWTGGELPDHDPSDYRRLRQHDLVPERFPEPAFGGEETYPLHPLLVRVTEPGGFSRTRTLLWGYVPLGGQVRVDGPPAVSRSDRSDGSDRAGPEPDYPREHAWPFGIPEGRALPWTKGHGYQVRAGSAEPAFRELLKTLLGRYRVQDAADPDNAPLRQLLARIHFHGAPLQVRRTRVEPWAEPGVGGNPGVHTVTYYSALEAGELGEAGDPMLRPEDRQASLLEYLDRRHEQVLEWVSWQERGFPRALPAHDRVGAEPPESEVSLPRLPWSLYVAEAEAELLRDLLEQRARRAVAVSDQGTAVPRFGQEEDDVFFVLPFLRYRDTRGCERVAWGPASAPFRVASPLEPEAQRPSLIPLPDLASLKRGRARGVTFLAPKSLADKIAKLTFDMDLGTGGPGNRAGACLGLSFSLPVITLCALILLMVMVNLLNIVFFWLPYAFLALPRLCLRALSGSGASGGGS